MKINFVLPGLGDSGGIRVVEKYAEIFKNQGHDVEIYSSICSNNLHRYSSKFKNMLHQLYCTMRTLVIYIKKKKPTYHWVWKINKKSIRKADVTVATMWATAYEVAKLPEYCGEKYYFIQGYEVWDNKKFGENSYRLPLNKIVVSTWINNQLIENLKLGPYPVITNGIDRNFFCEVDYKKSSSNGTIKCLMLNHKMESKGVEEGLEAFAMAKRIYSNLSLSMFGMCGNENLHGDIDYFQNPKKQLLLKLYREADIFIFPSLEEGWGLTPIEAMANKCVVVGSNTGFVLDMGENKKNMMINKPGDTYEMANSIVEIAMKHKLRHKISETGYKAALELNWNISAKKFIELLDNGKKNNIL